MLSNMGFFKVIGMLQGFVALGLTVRLTVYGLQCRVRDSGFG